MNKFKKIFSSILLVILLSWIINISQSFADDRDILLKEIIIAKYNLEQIKKWEDYIKKLDEISNSIEKKAYLERVTKITNNIEKGINILEEKTVLSTKEKDVIVLLKYLKVRLELVQYNLNKTELFKQTLSETEINKVENKIVDLQLNLFNKGANIFENILSDFEKLSNYEEKGNLKMNLNIDHEAIWKVNWELNIDNYVTKTSNFDSQFKWQLEALLNASLNWEDDIKMQLSWFLDFISKDWNVYLLLDKFNINNDSSSEQAENFLESIKKIASENKYIKFENNENTKVLETLKNLNPKNLATNWKEILSQALFTAYKKEWDKYILKPTKYACDKTKELKWVFDPFYANDKCSESQYQDVLKSFNEMWEIYLILWDINQIWYNTKLDDVEIKSFISYDEKSIKQISANIIPDQNKYPNEWVELSYKTNDSLYAKLYADKWSIDYLFDSKLDKNNRFSFLNFKGHTASKYEDFAVNLKLENKNLNWKVEYNIQNYDWDTDSYVKWDNIKVDLTWKTDYNNKLSNLNINLSWIDKNNKQFIYSKFLYNTWEISFENHFNDTYLASDIIASWKWDSINKVLKEWNLEISLKSKDYYSEDEELKDIFNSKISLENKIINWYTTIYNWNEKPTSITHTWKYEKGYFELNNQIEIASNPFSMQWYSQDLKNSKVQSDLRTLTSIIEIWATRWTFSLDKDLVIRDNKYEWENLYISARNNNWEYENKKAIAWKNYFVWKINFDILWQNWDNFKNPWDDNDYLIWIYNDWTTAYYQVFWYIIEGNEKKAIMKWNYVKKDESNANSLISYNWKTYSYYDLIEKIETNTKTEKVTWNFNIITDLRDNSNNLKLYYDINIDNDKIIEFSLENKSDRTYKDVEIETPSNTINSSDLFPNTNY